MQGPGIEVSAIGPHQRARFRVDANLPEHPLVAQRTVQLPRQHRPEIDRLLGSVVKANTNRVRGDDFKTENRDSLALSSGDNGRRNRRRGFAVPSRTPARSGHQVTSR